MLNVEAVHGGLYPQHFANRLAVRFPEVTSDFRELGERATLLFIPEPVGDDLFGAAAEEVDDPFLSGCVVDEDQQVLLGIILG